MAEIRDIKPADPLWQKRQTEKIRPDSNPDTPQKERRRRRDPRGRGEGPDRSRGGHIDEYA